LQTGWAILKRALLAVSGTREADFRATYRKYSDSGETAESLLAGKTSPPAAPWPLAEAPAWFARLAELRGPQAKAEHLEARFAVLRPVEAKYLAKIITGDLRIGLKEGLVEEALAAHFGIEVRALREANMLTGDLGAVAAAATGGELARLGIRTFRPVQFMLASPEPDAEGIVKRLAPAEGEAEIWTEEKYDGIRCQVHKAQGRVALYSRELREITGQFPDLARAVEAVPVDFIGDGELLAWSNGKALPFAELQKRLGRKIGAVGDLFLGEEIPVSLWLYDLLWFEGESLLKSPLRKRRARLESLPAGERLQVAPVTRCANASEIDAAFLAARQRGNEGLMAKDPASPYQPGRRGHQWLKLKKAYATLDVVVVGVEWGHGKRRGVLSDYTFAIRDERSGELRTIGKAYSGLTDAEIAEYTEYFLEHTIEEKGRYRLVEPSVILEVAFDSIQPSTRHQSGYALRFPRIKRLRDDKKIGEIDTLAHCQTLAGAPPAVEH
ncbi:MAG: ATP-dependent DNA ligase, partial [Verrucomicrobiota bacterium]